VNHPLEPVIGRFKSKLGKPLCLTQCIQSVLEHRALNHRYVVRTVNNQPIVANVTRELVPGQPPGAGEEQRLHLGIEFLPDLVADLADPPPVLLGRLAREKHREIPVAAAVRLAPRLRAEQHDAFDLARQRREHALAKARRQVGRTRRTRSAPVQDGGVGHRQSLVVAPTLADRRRAADLHRPAARATGSASRWRVER
jgi:hypothetical protein